MSARSVSCRTTNSPQRPATSAPVQCHPIRFGREGKPYCVSGPRDNPRAVVRTLEAAVGAGNYDYIAQLRARVKRGGGRRSPPSDVATKC
jgi:hypothetical protein